MNANKPAFAFIAVLLLCFTGLSFSANSQSNEVDSSAELSFVHYGDLIDVDVIGSIDGDWRGTVDPEGFLQGLLYAPEPIYALCKSEKAIAAEIEQQYAKTLKDPRVVVKILDRSGRAATLLLGAVKNQQRFKIKRETRLSEILALSGGITDLANGEITIARPADLNCFAGSKDGENKLTMIKLTIAKLLNGGAENDPLILSGDIVTVVEASPIYVIGGVNTPRQISSKDEMTVSRAIASAGGLAKEAVESDVTIYRRDGKQTRTLAVDLKKVRSNSQEDVTVKPFDIIDVGQKGKTKPKFPPSINADSFSRDIYKLPVRIIE